MGPLFVILTGHAPGKFSAVFLDPSDFLTNDTSFNPPFTDAPPWLLLKVFGKEMNYNMRSSSARVSTASGLKTTEVVWPV